MTLVFDTSALSPLLNGDDTMLRVLSRAKYDELVIPLATDAEIRFGFAYGTKQAENLANYELFKQQFGIQVVNPDQDVSVIYAELAAWARTHGVALSNNDIWIAATGVHLGAALLARDQDFSYLPQVRLANLSA